MRVRDTVKYSASLLGATIWLGSNVAFAQHTSLQDIAKSAHSALPPVVIYQAKEIVTLDPAKPTVQAVAVVGDRILAVGTMEEVKAAAGSQPHSVNTTFANQVIVPGFIAQHDHPVLAALTMTSEIIAIEDWVLPDRTAKAAKSREDYLARLAQANARLTDPTAPLLTWGYHHLFHGQLKKSDLDAISKTRPILVWHRSAHEFYLNSAAEAKYGVTKDWFDKLPPSARLQANFANAHYWEQGFFALLPLIAPAVATPEKLRSGLEFVRSYYHANGVTAGAEPGGIASKPLQDMQNAVLGAPSTPFRWYYMVDGKTVTAAHPDDKVAEESAKFLSWGQGMTSYRPKQVKLFADGAIFSQLMQMKAGYRDGHKGEWIMEPDAFARSFRVYWDLDYQIHVHVNGDAGLDMVLDQLEISQRRRPRTDHRTVIVHFAISTPEHVERIKRLGAIVSGNTYYPVALSDNYRVNGLDPERADPMARMGDVERAGISFSFHADMPMAPGQPLLLMWAGVNRVTSRGRITAKEQQVSRLGALKAITIEAAYSLQLEKEIGSIEPGKLANFTILSENPLTVEPMRIKDIAVRATVHEGRVLPIGKSGGQRRAEAEPGRRVTDTIPDDEPKLITTGVMDFLKRQPHHH